LTKPTAYLSAFLLPAINPLVLSHQYVYPIHWLPSSSQLPSNSLSFHFPLLFDYSDPVIPAESKTILKNAGIRNFSLLMYGFKT
ncbi:hypothetical protein P3526_25375, partial [Vibrio parahaemolyticus]|nr:hypothetical protein [Vibrio parahaemolyticus]